MKKSILSVPAISNRVAATGGTEIISGSYRIHKFTSSGTFTVNKSMNVECIVVAGGGAGGSATYAGGGGAGGVVYDAAHAVTGKAYTITVGAGGASQAVASQGNSGANSVFDDITAIGGGGGGDQYNPYRSGTNGGSGGGAGNSAGSPGSGEQTASGGDIGYGNNGGSANAGTGGAGGGGAGAAGTTGGGADIGGAGGNGISTYSDFLIAADAGVDISGTHWIAGGGGGGGYSGEGAGGNGGGGKGSHWGSNASEAGTANTGSGGGGASTGSYIASGAGGSGIVIIRYLLSEDIISDVIYVADADGVLRAFNSSLVQQWIFDTGAEVTSRPAIDPVDGTVYVGNVAGNLFALNPNNGSLKWVQGVTGAIRGSPVIGPNPLNPLINAIYVATDSEPGNGYVYAIDPVTGLSVIISGYISWRYNALTPIRTTPAIGPDGTIYVGGDDAQLHAINPIPYGSPPYVRAKWTYDTGTGDPITLSPVVDPIDGSIYFGSRYTYNYIYCVDSTGGSKWSYPYDIRTNPSVDTSGNVYFGLGYGLVSMSPSGDERWFQPDANASYLSTPLIKGDYVYVGRLSGICAYALSDGTPKYSCETNVGLEYPFGTPVIASTGIMYAITFDTSDENILTAFTDANVPSNSKSILARAFATAPVLTGDGTIYFGSENSKLYSITPDGSSNWIYNTTMDIPITTPPAIGSDGTIYFSCYDTFFAVSSDGSSSWSVQTGGYNHTSPTIDSLTGYVYIADDMGILYAIDPAMQQIEWYYGTPIGYAISSCPAISPDNGSIYFGDINGDLYALALSPTDPPSFKWSYSVGKPITTSPAIDPVSGKIYVTAEDTLFAIVDNTTEGILSMSYRPYAGSFMRCSPAIGSDGVVYVTTDESTIHAINSNGTEKWEIVTISNSMSSISITANNILLIGFDEGNIVAYDANDGTELWNYTTTMPVISSPAIASDGTIYVTNKDGILYAFESLAPTSGCPTSLKYENDIIHLSATPKDGIGPYSVAFRKKIEETTTNLISYTDVPENTEKTYDYTLTNEDIRTAYSGTIDFSVFISDSCPTGAQTCSETCTIDIGCIAPVCNFTVT